MMRTWIAAVLVGLVLAITAAAQSNPVRFRWQAGQVLTYRVEQTTAVAEQVGEEKTSSKSRMTLLKRWQVQGIDGAGVATLQLSLAALRLETTTPGGETLLFDSTNLDRSSPQLREQMERFVGVPLAVLRVDGRGQVVEVKESKFGPASRYQNELPFTLLLPEKGPAAGEAWERAYQMTLDPPQGAGEKYDALQKYVCTKTAGNALTVSLSTTLKAVPESVADQLPLLQYQPQGEIVFDIERGLLLSARTSVDRELTGHQGAGSRYHFQSTYLEEYVLRQ
jgi:hypothetical protein